MTDEKTIEARVIFHQGTDAEYAFKDYFPTLQEAVRQIEEWTSRSARHCQAWIDNEEVPLYKGWAEVTLRDHGEIAAQRYAGNRQAWLDCLAYLELSISREAYREAFSAITALVPAKPFRPQTTRTTAPTNPATLVATGDL